MLETEDRSGVTVLRLQHGKVNALDLELLREITERYLPPEQVPAYLARAQAEFGPQVVIYLRPERWLSQDLGPS